MIKVTVTGSECTGKTTLARALADQHHVRVAPEFVREFVRREERQPTAGDVESIARGQIAEEDRVLRGQPVVAILDTDLLSTVVYARHYFGDCPEWVERASKERAADLYLLCDIDVPWVADGLQRDRPGDRDEIQALFREELVARQLRFVEVQGLPAERLRSASQAITELLRR